MTSGSALLIPIFLLIYLAGVAKPNRRWRPATAECDQSDYPMEVMVGAKNITVSSAREWR